jgi:hypothetical protein
MTSIELWTIYIKKNPRFQESDATFTFTGAGLRKFFDQTYEQGYKQGKADAEAEAEPRKQQYDMPDFFRDIFK